MSENADPRPQDREASDPWAPPERRNEPVELGKRPAADPLVHDRPTVTSIPVGDPAGGELPPPPVAPGGPSAYGAPTPPPSYGYPAAGPGAYGYPAAGPGAYGYPPAHPSPYGPMPGQYNGMGTAGMVLGIIGTCLFWFYGVPSIVLGVLALIFGILGRKRAHRGEASNGGAATAGIVLGIVSAVLGAAVVALVVWAVVSYDEYEESGREGTTTSAVLVLGDR
ncbi:DUF4190 domain-containing protein [Streptomyces hydrogenans]|uniref:DUF4190 domain-containing protein n=1 Tax=Streptomyces hydrogenans TaxID=1873719 RepID=A0ABQ3P417_9ACTN|nr:DUF4190 domain-containing protein [Streptomyces hydrogenans]GHG27635.1 hypothetical protein GCM10018784_46280 [Streptomyces hydrogenans]GHI19766.1 hypothetical protein Shyd_11370 [Streptomyces hydrogenans]